MLLSGARGRAVGRPGREGSGAGRTDKSSGAEVLVTTEASRPTLRPERELASAAVSQVHEIADEHRDAADAALEILLDPALDPIVDMVLTRRDGDYEALTPDGSVRFRRAVGGTLTVTHTDGRNPFAEQAPDRFTPLAEELANKHPNRRENTYPHAYDQVAQLFDSPAAPDLCVIHSASHNWADQGGHLGEHGSLGVVQSRAPLVFAGTGVRSQGVIPDSARLVDVAPTVAALLGCAPRPDGRVLAIQDGIARTDILDEHERPRHVVGFLFDGTNANVLYDMAARGEAPNVARLIAMGTAFGHGAMASLPTVTLANHTTILTGAHPGHHGILHNAWYDRARATDHHQLVGHVADRDGPPHAGHGIDPRRGAPHVAGRFHRVGERAV